jgi:ABC-type transporter lipoprotein component MlaA
MTVMAEEEFDPFEDANRVIFEFNQGLDETLFEPVAKSYKENVPKPAQNLFVQNLPVFFPNPSYLPHQINQTIPPWN